MEHGIAVIGQGYMARTHLEGWSELGLAPSVRAILGTGERTLIDPIPDARYTTELDDLLADPAITIIDVCTPTPTHAGFAVRALDAGKHVLLEKPIALTVDDAERIRVAAERSAATLMVAQVVRFFGGYQRLREAWEDGALGELVSARAVRAINTPRWAEWWADERISGGVTVDFAIHDYDQLNLFLGEPVSVTAVQPLTEGPIETTIAYRSGAIGQVLSFAYTPVGVPFTSSIELYGRAGIGAYRFTASAPTGSGEIGETDDASTLRIDGVELHRAETVPDNRPYTREIEYFLQCVETGEPPSLSTTESAIAALRVSLAARQSLRTGGPVALDAVGGADAGPGADARPVGRA